MTASAAAEPGPPREHTARTRSGHRPRGPPWPDPATSRIRHTASGYAVRPLTGRRLTTQHSSLFAQHTAANSMPTHCSNRSPSVYWTAALLDSFRSARWCPIKRSVLYRFCVVWMITVGKHLKYIRGCFLNFVLEEMHLLRPSHFQRPWYCQKYHAQWQNFCRDCPTLQWWSCASWHWG